MSASRPADPNKAHATGPFAGRTAKWSDWGIGTLLGICYVVLVMQTTSMGITRDESFYIHYGKVYFNWFTSLSRAEGEERDELLSREGVKKVWKQNFEHPPLMKVLFGVSWRLFGNKERAVTVGEDGQVEVSGLGLSHGFEPGDEVSLLAPAPVDDGLDARAGLGRFTIEKRDKNRAWGTLEGDIAGVHALCGQADQETQDYLTGCRATSSGTLQFLSESDAFRFPGALMGGLLILLIYLLAIEFGSTAVALLTVGFFVFVPRIFFHAHLTCFDIPITAVSFAVLYGFIRSLRSTGWAIATGFLWGVALLTKLNSFFLPITLLMWWGIAGIRSLRWRGAHLGLPQFPLAFLLMPLIGLPMLFVLWPWLWYDAIESFGKYLAFHLEHEHYFQYYFGRAYQSPPFPIDMPYVLTLVTVPVVTIVLFLAGFLKDFVLPLPRWFRSFAAWRQRDEGLLSDWGRGWFVFINLAFPVTLIALPNTPVFGGVKHWFLTMPFLAMLAAHGLQWGFAGARRALPRIAESLPHPARLAVAVVVSLIVLAPAVRDTLRYVSFGTAYYNELIGGLRGAADRRMQRQFWSFASRSVLPYVNQVAPADCDIDYQDATRGTCTMQKSEGWMRGDLGCVTRKHAPEIMLFDVEERFSEEEMRYWKQMDTLGPVHEGGIDGVPMVKVYRKHAGSLEMSSTTEEENPDGL